LLKYRLIPTLLLKDSTLVKGVGFNSWRRVGAALPAIKVYNLREVDELILLDISATPDCREPDYDVISDLAAECFVPFTVGGGISSIEHIKKLLRAGADKVCINSAAYAEPEFIKEAVKYFGSQCIVISIDVKKNTTSEYECYSHCGKKNTGKSLIQWASELETIGVGEIILTSIENDGLMQGYDIELYEQLNILVSMPVIASGGASTYQDFVAVIEKGGASAVAAASIFHFTEQTPFEAKSYMQDNDILVRLPK
jgi:imidazole glycerol-phosphate synthase subunit HisF